MTFTTQIDCYLRLSSRVSFLLQNRSFKEKKKVKGNTRPFCLTLFFFFVFFVFHHLLCKELEQLYFASGIAFSMFFDTIKFNAKISHFIYFAFLHFATR